MPELAQHKDALAKSHNACGEPLSREGTGNLNGISKVHLKELADLTAEKNALHDTILELQSQLDLSNAEVHRLQDEQKPMLDAILDKSAGQKPMEHDLKKDFGDLRNAVKGLGISRVYASSGKSTCPYVARPSSDDEFYSAWNAANTNDRRLLMRMWMFNFLHENILDHTVFGVPNIATASRSEKRNLWFVERSLGQLEVALQSHRVPEEDIVKWRRATYKCVQSCQHDDSFSEYWATTMYNIFERLIVEEAESSEIEKLKRRFSQVCQTAARIRLAMRDQDKRYRCVVLKQGQLLADNEQIADWSAVFDGKIDEPGKHVKFTLFGALVKHSGGDDGEAILVPADVAMASRADEQRLR
ncbi:hypothetical protein LEL_08657 [Akanthomyces lecanii RCEF 1005]|uniref:Uncharacterized protein n=1 Tax=Akanthomyces lecanii RCEF 1005 TaxID=1081108 RepID=A0A168DQ09_CORDF|nr:hypothetical protein LEL_08657 [Akanthomyces lecanii RCEF 1005]